jgi:hypothetical protein
MATRPDDPKQDPKNDLGRQGATSPENDPGKTEETRPEPKREEQQQGIPVRLGPEAPNEDLVADPDAQDDDGEVDHLDGPAQRQAQAQADKGGGGFGNNPNPSLGR